MPRRSFILDAPCTIQAGAAGTKRGTFSGLAYAGGTLRVAQWSDPVVLDLAGVSASQHVRVLGDHSTAITGLLGEAEISVSETGINVAGTIVPGAPAADRALAFADAGLSVPLSVGVEPARVERVRAGEQIEVNGRSFTGPIDVVRACTVREISMVGLGADPDAAASIAATHHTRKDHNPMPRTSLETNTSDPAQTERDRIQGIRAAFRGIGTREADDACDRAIDGGATLEEAQRIALGLLRAARPTPTSVRGSGGGGGGTPRDMFAAAILIHGGAEAIAARHHSEQTMQLADQLRARAGSILGLAREALRTAGHPEPASRDDLIRATFSTDYGLGDALQSAIRVVALDAFRTADEPWRSVAHRTPLNDFKPSALTRLAGSFQFHPVPPGGELKHATLDAETTPIKLGTHGAIVTLDRQTLINDTAAGLINQVPTELAREASRIVGDSLAVLLADAGGTFFTAERENFMDGGESALSISALAYAVRKLRTQTDKSGRRLNLAPSHLIVSAALESTARAILGSSEIATIAEIEAPSGNPMKGIAELVVDARLADSEWFLTSKPSNAAIVVGTLNGADNPIVEAKETPADTLGASWRAYFDFGVALHEFRAIFKSAGQ